MHKIALRKQTCLHRRTEAFLIHMTEFTHNSLTEFDRKSRTFTLCFLFHFNFQSSCRLQTSQCMWLMQALGFLLSALPVEDILRNLHSLITPYIQQLEKLADETVRSPSCGQWAHTATHMRACTHLGTGLQPIGTGRVSAWCQSAGTFLCGTRLDLTSALRASESYGSSKCILSLVHTRSRTSSPQQEESPSGDWDALGASRAFVMPVSLETATVEPNETF